MPTIHFYHLLTTPLEQALFRLASKILQTGKQALLIATPERCAHLDTALWTSGGGDSFLPHGLASDAHPEKQPLLLSSDTAINPNGAAYLLLLDGYTSPLMQEMERTLVIFDGRDEQAVHTARTQWKEYKEQGCELVYYKQNDRGGWDVAG